MNDKDIARTEMFYTVRAFCQQNILVLNTYSPFAAMFADFDAKLETLHQYTVSHFLIPEGYTIDKARLRTQLEKEGK